MNEYMTKCVDYLRTQQRLCREFGGCTHCRYSGLDTVPGCLCIAKASNLTGKEALYSYNGG